MAYGNKTANGADGKTTVKRMKYHQGIELLLDILPQGAVHSFLHITLENASGLIHYLGNLLHKGKKGGNSTELKRLENQKNAAAQIISVLGLLLYKCDIRKEKYMEEMAYLLGQLLHVSDELHTLYCKAKRDGDIPPQLAGALCLRLLLKCRFRHCRGCRHDSIHTYRGQSSINIKILIRKVRKAGVQDGF